jgi:RimJ/RimL family protein N-acetyltransferase
MLFRPIDCGAIQIRAFVEGDLPTFAAYRAEPEVARYQSWTTYTYEDARRLFDTMQEHPFGTPGEWFQLAIASSDTDALLGDLAVHFIDDEQVELGFTLSPAHQGKGVASLALREMVTYLFHTMKKHRIIATIDVDNVAARRLLEAVGFRQEAHFVENIFFKGAWGSEFQYALLASEWQI